MSAPRPASPLGFVRCNIFGFFQARAPKTDFFSAGTPGLRFSLGSIHAGNSRLVGCVSSAIAGY